MRALLAAITVVLGLGSAAHAKPGTFLIAEGEVGFGLGDAFPEGPTGIVGGVTLGAGGKPRGSPLRFYGVLNLGWASYSGEVDSPIETATIERDTFAWSAGLRVISPIVRRLRFFAEATLGGYAVTTEGRLGGGAELVRADDGSFLVGFAAGLQWRFNLAFSLGARFDLAVPTSLESFDPIAEAAGAASSAAGFANLGFGLTATFHL
ncbi:MAG: hypothetical protein IT385_25840 [Deltaproteobacteria bacterium]|nr:hypothetical protein [Deltaproteobacteria bacterium]